MNCKNNKSMNCCSQVGYTTKGDLLSVLAYGSKKKWEHTQKRIKLHLKGRTNGHLPWDRHGHHWAWNRLEEKWTAAVDSRPARDHLMMSSNPQAQFFGMCHRKWTTTKVQRRCLKTAALHRVFDLLGWGWRGQGETLNLKRLFAYCENERRAEGPKLFLAGSV